MPGHARRHNISVRGRLSRRGFMRAGAAGTVGAVGAGFLAGRTREAGPDRAPSQDRDIADFLADAGGRLPTTTLRVAVESNPFGNALAKLARAEFEPATGLRVQWTDRPVTEVYDQLVQAPDDVDIVNLDQAWLGTFGPEMLDIRGLQARPELALPGYDFDDFLTPLVDANARHDGRLIGVPYDIPIFGLMYRKDVLDQVGVGVPGTLEAYAEAVRAVHEAGLPGLDATAGQWCNGHYALLCETSTWLWAHGGSFYGQDGAPAIDDARGHAALDYMRGLAPYMAPEAVTWDWNAQAQRFAGGRTALQVSWLDFMPVFDDPATSHLAGLIGVAPVPTVIAPRSRTATGFSETPGPAHQGGSVLAIPRRSAQTAAAWVFVQWATSADVMARASLLSGGTPVRASVYADPRVQAAGRDASGQVGHFELARRLIETQLGSEPRHPGWEDLAVDGFAYELGRFVTGEQSTETTLRRMADAARAAHDHPEIPDTEA